jgi:hypothetical protein
MGAWGSGPFQNDDALDWLADLEGSTGLGLVEEALDQVNAEVDYLETFKCFNALAAAEVVAALAGEPAADLPEKTETWISDNAINPAGDLLSQAMAAVSRIKQNSELRELWEESEDSAEWLAGVEDLERRLWNRS